ncbi:uncharacterized protein LOC141703361 [Apium graveolens]|uniref:uncharacterized protein LOC141703361 n=1 Tax=Apium graveolens TaxID=4045 RepID=UPI003D78C2B8
MIMKEGESLDDFCLKLNGLVTNIRTLGDEMAEAYVVKKVLRAMPHKFLQITSAIEQFGDLEKMSIEEVIGSLKAHEERLRGQPDASGGTNQLLLTEEEWRKKDKEENCKKPKRDKEQREEANMVQVPDDEPALLLTECDEGEKNVMLINEEKVSPKINKGAGEVVSNLWYLDNGASNHMTGQKSKFKELNEEIKGQVKFGDGSLVQIKGKGSIAIQCKTGDERILHDVYYIPALCSNIISLGQMAEEGYKISMNGDFLWVRDTQDILFMKVKRSLNRLYKIIINTGDAGCLLSEGIQGQEWLWHSRLGHVNANAMQEMGRDRWCTGCQSYNI